MRSEDAAIDVALVDDDVLQSAQEARPPGVPGQHRPVQQVRVGQDVRRVRPYPLPLLVRGVPVVGRGPYAGHVQRQHRPQLIGRQCLGRGEVQHRRTSAVPGRQAGTHCGQRREQVGERLARGGPGRDHDRAARVRELGGLDLMRPRCGDAFGDQTVDQVPVGPRRPGGRPTRSSRYLLEVDQSVFASRGRTQPGGEVGRIGRLGRCAHDPPSLAPPKVVQSACQKPPAVASRSRRDAFERNTRGTVPRQPHRR